MKRLTSFMILLASTVWITMHAATTKIYVDGIHGKDTYDGTLHSPIRTFEELQKRLLAADTYNDIVVYIRDGVYELTSPLVFDEKMGGNIKRKIELRAYQEEQPVLCGGYRVKGWQLYDADRSVYYAQLPETLDGRQFFVNGQRAVRARESDAVKRWIKSDSIGHLTSDMSLLKWKNPEFVECVYREIWTAPRCGVASITQLGDTLVRVTMKQPGWKNCRNKGITSTRTPWYWENAMELLDEEGEWYLDKTGAMGKGRNVLFYKPYIWENLEEAACIFPVLESLVRIEGTKENPVCNVRLNGLQLAYTTWLRPGTNRGNPDAQNNVMRQNATGEGESMAEGAAVVMRHAQHISIDNCSFLHLGCNGINMEAGCSYNEVSRSLFYDLAATAIQMGNYKNWQKRDSEDSYDPEDKRNLLRENLVEDNHIELCGVEYRSATGIGAAFPVSTVFRNNTLKDLPYSGFHIGWGWTTVPYTVNGDNLITRNKIQNVMVELADGGSIYTLGGGLPQAPTTITENYMNRTMWGQGVYLDNGSAFYHVSDNVYEKIDDYNVKINSGSHDIRVDGIYSNKVKNLLADKCDNCRMDSTVLFDKANARRMVDKIKKNAGAKRKFVSAWEVIPDKHIFELECAEMAGGAYTTSGIGTHVFDYCGMGFVSGFDREQNNEIRFKNKVSAGGKYVVKLRYSSAKDWNGKVMLKVNGKIQACELDETARGEWRTVTLQVDLKKGVNEISLFNTEKGTGHLFFDVMYIYRA